MKLFKNSFAILAALVLGLFAGCSNTLEEITDLDLDRCLEPMNLTARVNQGNLVTFNWDATKDAEQYIIIVYTDEGMTLQEYWSGTISPDQLPLTKSFEADQTYYFKVQAVSNSKEASKWAVYSKPIKTFAVKDNLFLEASDRGADNISLAWSTELEDYLEVDRIEYGLPGEEDVQTYTLSDEEKRDGKATIAGLTPGTEYVFTLYYKSASRGEVDVWTTPDPTGLTTVNSLAGLQNALKTPGSKILLTMDGSPYTFAEDAVADIDGAVEIYGQGAADGSMPVINGEFHITSAFSGGSIRFESVELNGQKGTRGFTIQLKNGGGIKDAVKIDDITFRNCVITGYSKGLLYEWGQPMDVGSLNWESCDINNINADGTGGGDVIDLRGTASSPLSSIGAINIVNNTMYTGGRTYLRIDFPQSLGDIKVENNTMFDLCVSDNTNNAGLVAIQTQPSSVSFKNNLVIGMGEKAKLGGDNTVSSGGFNGYKYLGSDNISFANNHYYDVAATFFNNNMKQSDATGGGGSMLEEDPCYNAKAGLFNLTNADLVAAKVGASKWWVGYVEKAEDLTLGTIEGKKTWLFSNAKLFSGTIKSDRVRDYLYISADESTPIVVDNGMAAFQTATVTNKKGVPQLGYFKFKVTEPGSVYIKVADPEGLGNHVVIGVGPLDGSSVTIKGGASALVDMDNAQKILISDITEECFVYVWVSGPVAISQLAWSTDTTPLNTALPTPQPSADPAAITVGDATDIVVSWPEVADAASYSVVFGGKTYAVEEGTSYTISAITSGMLDAGSYTVEVYANPGEDDIYNTESAPGVAAFAVQPKSDGGEGEGLVVKDVEQLLAAITAGKSEITLAPGTYDLTESIAVSSPLSLKGQDGAVVNGAAFTLAGTEAQTLSLENLTLNANGQGILVGFDAAGATLSDIVIKDCSIDGYSKSIIYSNADANNVGNLLVKGNIITNQGTGQGGFDFRKGTLTNVSLTENTFNGGFRDFIRMDSGVVCSTLDISHNTFFDVSNNASNTVLYVRNKNARYTVSGNLFHTMNVILAKSGDATAVPAMSGNYYFNVSEKFFTGRIDEETAKGGGGVVLGSDPCKDAATGDFTLVNALAISEQVGDPRWCPSAAGGSTDSFTVSSVDEFNAAVEAGKTDIKFALSGTPYDLSAAAITLPAGTRLSGETSGSDRPTVTIAQLNIAGEAGTIILEDINFVGSGSNSFLNVTDAATAEQVIVRNCSISTVSKSVFYDNAGATVSSLVFNNVVMSGLGGGQGTIDIRKGTYGTVTVKNCTVVGGRDFIRADAGRVTGAVNISNNIFDGCTLNNGNGILYVRSTPESYVVNNNLFLNENGENNLLCKASGVTVPTAMGNNWFYNCTAAKFWTGLITQEIGTAGGGILDADPVKDAAAADYTITNSDLAAAGVGPACWR